MEQRPNRGLDTQDTCTRLSHDYHTLATPWRGDLATGRIPIYAIGNPSTEVQQSDRNHCTPFCALQDCVNYKTLLRKGQVLGRCPCGLTTYARSGSQRPDTAPIRVSPAPSHLAPGATLIFCATRPFQYTPICTAANLVFLPFLPRLCRPRNGRPTNQTGGRRAACPSPILLLARHH